MFTMAMGARVLMAVIVLVTWRAHCNGIDGVKAVNIDDDMKSLFGTTMDGPAMTQSSQPKIVPKYMWNIYNQIADPKTGETKVYFPDNGTAKPFIESFTAKKGARISDAISLSFNLSMGNLSSTGPNHLELAIKRKWKRLLSKSWANDIQLEIGMRRNSTAAELILHTTLLKAERSSEYDVFDLSRILSLEEKVSETLSLFLRLRSSNGKLIPPKMIHFMYKLSPKSQFRPVMVLYHGLSGPHEIAHLALVSRLAHRARRSVSSSPTVSSPAAEPACSVREMMVYFSDLGWQDKIIAPPQYDAKVCDGKCDYPLNQANNHANIQAMIQLLPGKNIPTLCCSATSLKPLSVLYSGSDGNVVVRQWKDMIVDKCSCK